MNKNNILLTVIITVYNIAPYLSKCIESVTAQTYRNIEVLLIDDGSTDGSGNICDTYALKDARINVIHKRNQGLVSARKTGVEAANGEVITFVDGDDWIEPDMYQHMIAAYIKDKPELVTSGLIYESEEEKCVLLDSVIEGVYEREFIQRDILPRIAYDSNTGRQGIMASVCNKLFQTTKIRKIVMDIDPQITMGEDGTTVYILTAQVNKMVVMNQAWYHYMQRKNSMIRTYSLDTFERLYTQTSHTDWCAEP